MECTAVSAQSKVKVVESATVGVDASRVRLQAEEARAKRFVEERKDQEKTARRQKRKGSELLARQAERARKEFTRFQRKVGSRQGKLLTMEEVNELWSESDEEDDVDNEDGLQRLTSEERKVALKWSDEEAGRCWRPPCVKEVDKGTAEAGEVCDSGDEGTIKG